MKAFRRFAFVSAVIAYLLIFTGGLVRVSGAGLGCPDWPKCFGRWIPPTDVSQLPADMDPSMFNFTLAWIEYLNRLIGFALGILVLITAFLAIIRMRNYPRILYLSVVTALLVAYQGWQGGQVVTSQLRASLVSLHMFIAVLIASILTYVTQRAYYFGGFGDSQENEVAARARLGLGVLWVLVVVQIILGSQVRSAVEAVKAAFPLMTGPRLAGAISAVNYIHMALGILIVIYAWDVGIRILRKSARLSGLVRDGIWTMMALALAQLIFGLVLVIVGMPALMQVFHLWTAGMLAGTLLLLYSILASAPRGEYAAQE